MKARFGLLSSIIMCFMTICFLVVGVWSATEHNFEVNGSIEYTAPIKGYTVELNVESIESYYKETLTIWKYDGTTQTITSTGTYTIDNVVQMQLSCYDWNEPVGSSVPTYNAYIVDGDTETYAFGVELQIGGTHYSDLYEVTQNSSYIIKTEITNYGPSVDTNPGVETGDSGTGQVPATSDRVVTTP